MAADPKDGKRIVDGSALRRALVSGQSCAACHSTPGSVHHVVQRGAPFFGDDVAGNLLLLCGSGTTGCHGAWHGSPYEVERRTLVPDGWAFVIERRDQAWVSRRVGATIRKQRPDVIAYVLAKLGENAGWEYLVRNYRIEEVHE